jgi:carboxyl-terminal processing protease
MTIIKKRHIKLWLVLAVAVVFSTLGTGFYKNLSADGAETYRGLKLFSDVIEIVEKTYVDEVDPKELIEKAINGMVTSLDPHSSLLLPDALKDLQIDTQGEFTGIGIRIAMKDGYVTVISPIVDTPAYRAGIEAGDKIVKVDGEAATDLRQAVKMIRGPKGTQVVVTIIREGIKNPIDFKLTRDVIPIESVKSIVLKPGYGYVWITNFRDHTTEDLTKSLDQLESANKPLKGLVLDLRNNPGGLLNQAIRVSDIFLENGTILSIKGRLNKNTKTFNAKPNPKKRNYPIIVLINGGSASASEIVAGALQDQKRALILGTTSFGKGSVQTVETLRDGYGLKLTIARYYTPSGRSIQAKGIEPDVIVKKERMNTTEAEGRESGLTKEKDLKNHLEATPENNQNKPNGIDTKDKQDGSDEHESDMPEMDDELIKLERLQSDNQVMRALDILLSYEIFKGIRP